MKILIYFGKVSILYSFIPHDFWSNLSLFEITQTSTYFVLCFNYFRVRSIEKKRMKGWETAYPDPHYILIEIF